jgi:NAD(P)-dependent dehydrogenase (short-subunit alcohol dehydrogenase family)
MGQQTSQPPQEQELPGREDAMTPRPRAEDELAGRPRLEGKRAFITGGDSGIGRAVAIAFAREGADVAIAYRDAEEDDDAMDTLARVREHGRRAHAWRGDLGDPAAAVNAVEDAVEHLGGLDVLVNNAAEQHVCERVEDIAPEQLERTFRTNVFAMFHCTRAALAHLGEGASVINTTSITAYQGNPVLVDYSATKGAIVAYTRALSQQVIDRGIRVNAVAPGPIWTPLIPATFDAEQVESFGSDTPMKRPGQPEEVAGAYVFLASPEASYIAGQVIHVNGGQVVNG